MSSDIDIMFHKIFGFIPNKKGEALEIFSATIQELLTNTPVTHNQEMLGSHSGTSYQIDTKTLSDGKVIIGEAKDYSYSSFTKKVGRADIQKLAGALGDLTEVSEANFFASTDYTNPAKNYANASASIAKPINLNIIRPTNEDDLSGYISSIKINITYQIYQKNNAKFTIHFTEAANQILKSLCPEGTYQFQLEFFYDCDGRNILSLYDLTKNEYGLINKDTCSVQGTFLLPNHFIVYRENLLEIKGLEYDIPVKIEESTLEIAPNDTSCLTLKDKDNNIIAIFPEEKIKSTACKILNGKNR